MEQAMIQNKKGYMTVWVS